MSESPDPCPAEGDRPGRNLVPAETAAPALDAHGHDPDLYQWLPVLRKPRKDGWTPQRQRDFIAALADCGCVAEAARAAHMTERSCYRLRRESAHFAAAWEAAIAHAAPRLVDLAFDRVIHGSDEPVFDKEGRQVGRRMKQNDRLLMFLLRAYLPGRFRHAHQSVRQPAEPPPPVLPPLAEALDRLDPVPPQAPHLLLPPDELEDALTLAELGDGQLPHWHRGRGDAEPVNSGVPDEAFERDLTAAMGHLADPDDDAEDDPFLG